MTDVNQDRGGILDTKRATRRTVDPRELLRRIVAENPKADEGVWRKEFRLEVRDDEDYRWAITEFFLDRNIRSVVPAPAPAIIRKVAPAQRLEMKKQMKLAVTDHVVGRVTEKVQIALLALPMPNGKELGDCTGSECKQFGSWFAKVGDAVPAKAKVGDHLTEAQVQKLWRKTV